MAQLYLLDTNAASDVMNGDSNAVRLTLARKARSASITISSITAAELRFGIRKRGSARLQKAFENFCIGAQILPWDDAAAVAYGQLRYDLARSGTVLDVMDLLIAAHAVALGAVLVTRDKAFQQIKTSVKIENWATDLN
jgi:tRNA(fMet)-specific endonuclease VapC